MARYKLLIKKENIRKGLIDDSKGIFSFSVVDLQKGNYPFNWVCQLPKDCPGLLRNSKFSRLFSDVDSAKFAIQLLTKARREYDDIAIRQEIDSRITRITAYKSKQQSQNRIDSIT